MRKMYLFYLFFVTILVACQKDVKDESTVAATSFKNLSYGTDAQQKMDLYLPAGRDTFATPLLIMIHGGAWVEGDKADFNDFVSVLQQRFPRYAIANINYRLFTGGQNKFPTQENDIRTAVQWLLGKSLEYKYSHKIILLGASAGAHLALLQGYKYDTIGKPLAVISFFGPTDMTALYNAAANPYVPVLLTQIMSGTPTQNPSLYQQSSPVRYVKAGLAPTLLLQGGVDDIVPPAQATLLNNALQAAGITHQLVLYPSEGHGWTGANLDDSINKVTVFLQQYGG
ncbi:MAG: alpha/beta hydrolase [Chitinophagaceae bacterium]